MKVNKNIFNKIADPENLFLAWDEFKIGKQKKLDVQSFEKNLEQSVFELYRDLQGNTFRHGPYEGFFINDPKRRHIHKAMVRDRVLHHAVFRVLNPIFEPTFISNSFSCRIGKGNHKGVKALEKMLQKASRNNSQTCYALKCDIKRFFDSVDHQILRSIIERRIRDQKMRWLLREIIGSYDVRDTESRERERRRFAPTKEYPLAI